jgi:hypothetical protein
MLDEDAAQMRMQHRSVTHDLVELISVSASGRLVIRVEEWENAGA